MQVPVIINSFRPLFTDEIFPNISLIFSKIPDISLTAVKFPDISQFSKQVVTLDVKFKSIFSNFTHKMPIDTGPRSLLTADRTVGHFIFCLKLSFKLKF